MSIFGIVSTAFAYGSYGVSSGVSTIAMSGGAGSGTAAMPLFIASVEAPITGSTTAFISSLDQCSTWSSLNQDWVRYNNTTLEAWNVMPTSCVQGPYETKSATVFIKGASVVSFNVSMPMFIGNSGDGVISSATTAFMYAPAFEVASGTAFMSGYDYVNKAVDVFISGENYSSQSTGTLFMSGNDESTLESSLYIFGMENTAVVTPTDWTPNEISTVFWLDAARSSTITISTGVSTWADRKGSGVNAVQATAANQPSYSATAFPGSLPGVLFDGSNDVMDISTTAMRNQTHGVYWVWSRSGAGTVGDIYKPSISCLASAGQGTDRGTLHYVKNSNNLGASYPYYFGPATASYDLSSGTAYSNNVGNIMAFQSNTTGWGVWRNGTLEGTTNTIVTPDNTIVGYGLGRQYSPNRASNIVIGEVIMVESTNTTTRQLIEGYLAWKWGLQANLPVGHPYAAAAPTV